MEAEAVRDLLTDIEESVNHFVRKSDLWQSMSTQAADEVEQIVSQLNSERQLIQEKLDRNTSRINEVNFERAAICKTILSSAKVGVSEMELGVTERACSNLETDCCLLEAQLSLLQQDLDIQEQAIRDVTKIAEDLPSKIQVHKVNHELMKVRVRQMEEKAKKFAVRRIEALEASNEELAEVIEFMEANVALKKGQQELGGGEAEAGGTSSLGVSLERHIEVERQLARLELELNHGLALIDQVRAGFAKSSDPADLSTGY